jgi:hypothetical protein
MKYILVIWVCSFLEGSACMTPIKYPTTYNSWYECSRAAHVQSGKLLSKLGYAYVNTHQIGTRYHCKAVYTY